jgi:hypothetical protein
MKLPLVGFTADPIHGWNYLLDKLNLLQHAQHIAALLRTYPKNNKRKDAETSSA